MQMKEDLLPSCPLHRLCPQGPTRIQSSVRSAAVKGKHFGVESNPNKATSLDAHADILPKDMFRLALKWNSISRI